MSRSSGPSAPQFRGYEVPRADNLALFEPPPELALVQAADNAAQLARCGARFDGSPLRDLRVETRRSLVEAAYEWTAGCTATLTQLDPDPTATAHALRRLRERVEAFLAAEESTSPQLLFVGGHQPEIYHPGVWFKNLVSSRLACRAGSLPVNLLVDHDVPKRSSIRVPTLDRSGRLLSRPISFASLPSGVPWEQLDAGSIDLADDFARRVALMANGAIETDGFATLHRYWESVRLLVRNGYRLGEALAAARHAIELRRGWLNLELPLSRLCEVAPFGRFVSELTSRAAEVVQVYNVARGEYRAAHGMRSEAHPVPALQKDTPGPLGWTELPLWIYSDHSPRRAAAWIGREAAGWSIGDRGSIRQPLLNYREARLPARDWGALAAAGIKLRPRALMTTAFLRLFAADYFIHGIGGGKYDQLTDLLLRRLWDVEPPKFMVASASVHLPIRFRPPSGVREESIVRDELRRLDYHPDRFIDAATADAGTAELLRRKASLLSHVPPRGQKSQWHRHLTATNDGLSAKLSSHRAALQEELAESKRLQRQIQTLRSREHAVVLFEESQLTSRLEALIPCPTPGGREAAVPAATSDSPL